ncbi:hypothetical protein [Halalkalibacter alkalisediminis]|uniref:Lipoprotein n=1 Tax=Halalkalibacter alkalisediminis TaxID=935616 RepID=A0ABV6NJQ1_9BACI|nr:hypothetical protein [Halalkalibacter alkalisediminis]
MIKNKIYLAIPLLMGMITLVGCSGSNAENNQLKKAKETVQESTIQQVMTITVEERIDEGYKTVKVLDDANELKTVEEIIENADWEENVYVSMAIPPEYRFRLNPSYYAIWVTPNRDRLEIVIEGKGKYINLPEKESKALFELITGNELN